MMNERQTYGFAGFDREDRDAGSSARRRRGIGRVGKGLLFAIVSVLMAATVFMAGCSDAAAHDEEAPLELLIKVPRTNHEVVFDESISTIDQVISHMAREFEENYKTPDGRDIRVEVQVFEQTMYDDAVVDSYGTSDAPDILYGDYFNISTYIHTGHVVPVDDVVTEEVRESIVEDLWDMSTVEDCVYMMPYLYRQNVLIYNKNLFRACGLDEYIGEDGIQSWTKDDMTVILDTLAERLGDDAYPMMMYAASSQGDTHIMTLLRCAGSQFFDEDGHFNLSTPEGIEALRWLQDGVARGWYPPHSENLEIEDCSSLFRGNQLAIYMTNNVSVVRYDEDDVGLVNFPGPDEDGCATTFVSGFEVFDNGDEEKVQAAKDFLSFVYDNEDLMSYAAGTLPASIAVAEEYGDEIRYFDWFTDNMPNVVDFTGNNPDTRSIREVFYTHIHELLQGTVTPEEAAAAIDADCNAAIDNGLATSVLHD